MSQLAPVTLFPISGIPDVSPGDRISTQIVEAIGHCGVGLRNRDVLVVAHKIVSKSEGRIVDLRTVIPSDQASTLATNLDSDPRLVEVVLRESRGIVRADHGVLITETHHGFRCANAGVDRSNVGPPGAELVVLLPVDPDQSARRLHDDLLVEAGADVAVIINDSHGRPWRLGTVGLALGSFGIAPLLDLRGRTDMYGRRLHVSRIGLIDEIAAAASLVMGGADERVPAVLVRGVSYPRADVGAAELLRPRERDLFP